MATGRRVRREIGHRSVTAPIRVASRVLAIGLLAIFASYSVWVFTLPTHLEPTIYGSLAIPGTVAQQVNESSIRSRLAAQGYFAIDRALGNQTVLYVVPANDDRFEAWIGGLGVAQEGFVVAEGRYSVGYLKGDSWRFQESEFREKVSRLVASTALPLDIAGLIVGDNDFAGWNEFGLLLLHGFLFLAAAGGIAFWAAVDAARSQDGRSPAKG